MSRKIPSKIIMMGIVISISAGGRGMAAETPYSVFKTKSIEKQTFLVTPEDSTINPPVRVVSNTSPSGFFDDVNSFFMDLKKNFSEPLATHITPDFSKEKRTIHILNNLYSGHTTPYFKGRIDIKKLLNITPDTEVSKLSEKAIFAILSLSTSDNYPKGLLSYLEELAEQGNAEAQRIYGYALQNGKGVEKNTELSEKYYTLAAHQGFALAQNDLGNFHRGINDENAAKWYESAAQLGCSRAQYNLGCFYQKGTHLPKNGELAFKYFKLAADQGYPAAQYYVGEFYSNGKYVSKNSILAEKYYKLSAEHGEIMAQVALALCYYDLSGERFHATGEKKDIALVAKYFKLAADQGHVESQFILGRLYSKGEIAVPIDQRYRLAESYLKLAADQGYAAAQYKLGGMYLLGEGVKKDYELFEKYNGLAKKQGYVPKIVFTKEDYGLAEDILNFYSVK